VLKAIDTFICFTNNKTTMLSFERSAKYLERSSESKATREQSKAQINQHKKQ